MYLKKVKIIRTSTVPLSLKRFCKDLLCEIKDVYDVLAVSSPGKELDEINACGISTMEIKMERTISPWADLKSLIQLVRMCRKEKPYIIHSITPKAGLLTMVAARIANVPVRIHSFTGLLFPTATGIKKLILKATDRITCSCATHILPEGEGVKNDLINAGITNKELNVLGHGNLRGIDINYYTKTDDVKQQAENIAHRWNISEDDFVFVFVGRIVNDKGITELAEAFIELVKAYPSTHLIIVGEEEQNGDAISQKARQLLTTNGNVHFSEGWTDDVRKYYAVADALVFPSYREGFPNVVLEAGAMGLPSIVTDINGSNEIIINGFNGDIIPPRDSVTLFKVMKKYVESPDYVTSISRNCRPNIESKYEATYVRQCLKDYYKSILDIKQ